MDMTTCFSARRVVKNVRRDGEEVEDTLSSRSEQLLGATLTPLLDNSSNHPTRGSRNPNPILSS
jgi:hypothetical protein